MRATPQWQRLAIGIRRRLSDKQSGVIKEMPIPHLAIRSSQ
jgi:hypothetical protein